MSVKKAVKSAAKLVAFKIVYPAIYKISALRRVDSRRIIFAEVRADGLTDNFKYIYEKISENPKLRAEVFCVGSVGGGFKYLWRYALLAAKIGNAACVLINDTCNLFGAFKLRDKTKLVQTWHACGAFKRWGKSSAEQGFGESERELERYPAHTNYKLVTVSAEECAEHYTQAFGLKENSGCVKAIGVSRTDYYFKKQSREDAFKRLYEICPQAQGKRILLYAPTFRGEADKAFIPERLDIRLLSESFGEDYVLIIKRHGFVKKRWDIPKECKSFAFDLTDEIAIEQLLITADVCITDYSSLIFEYSLMLRPMIFFAFDLDEFYDYRGFFYPYDESFLPGDVAKTSGELVRLIRSAERTNTDRVRAFRDRFMGACDGFSTERIVDWILS